MKRVNWAALAVIGIVALAAGGASAGLHLDEDTGKWIEDGFDVCVYVDTPNPVGHLTFGRGGAFGTDLYYASYEEVHRVDASGQVSLFATLPANTFALAFPMVGSAFGEYLYAGSGDGYYGGDKSIYRIDPAGAVEVFVPGSHFGGGYSTANAINFSHPDGPYGDHLWSQDCTLDRVLRFDPDGSSTPFGGGIPLAYDFMFDPYGHFGGDMFVSQSEKSEHGSGDDNIWRICPDEATTLFLPDAPGVHNGGGCITPPASVFGGDMIYIDNGWAWPTGGTVYRVTPGGTRVVFAEGFDAVDNADVVLGPDDALYVVDTYGVIYRIVPEPAALGLLALGGLAMMRRRKRG